MGAVLGLVWSLTRQQPLARTVLLAPAFDLKWYLAVTLRLLCALLPRRLRLPSLGPAAYMAHRGTSLAAYGALLELIGTLRQNHGHQNTGRRSTGHGADGQKPPDGLRGLPPRLFLAWHEKDELISTAALARYADGAGERITTHALTHQPCPGATRHLGIDAHTLGDSEWAALLGALEAWLAR
jgi:alpha-beta hydrolase superfamily lysophospholipase